MCLFVACEQRSLPLIKDAFACCIPVALLVPCIDHPFVTVLLVSEDSACIAKQVMSVKYGSIAW